MFGLLEHRLWWLLLKIPHTAVPKLDWDKTTLPGHAMPPKRNICSLMLLQLTLWTLLAMIHLLDRKIFGVFDLQHTGLQWKPILPASLRATFFVIHPLQMALCKGSPLTSIPRGSSQTVHQPQGLLTRQQVQNCSVPMNLAWFICTDIVLREQERHHPGTQSGLLSVHAWASHKTHFHFCAISASTTTPHSDSTTFLSAVPPLLPSSWCLQVPPPALLCSHTHQLPLDTQPVLPEQDPEVLGERSHPWLTRPKVRGLRVPPPCA